MHNLVHRWVGGSMGPGTSPNDPVFFLHHCNVDRIWVSLAHWECWKHIRTAKVEDQSVIMFLIFFCPGMAKLFRNKLPLKRH